VLTPDAAEHQIPGHDRITIVITGQYLHRTIADTDTATDTFFRIKFPAGAAFHQGISNSFGMVQKFS
jgi:hypothetical protein